MEERSFIMRKIEIENWALKIVEQVKKKQPHEDSQVELKAAWIEEKRAARRIAGHANAARGESILWVIGVDEERGLLGVEHKDLAEWWVKVQAEFDGQAPALTDINIKLDEEITIVALLFETDRAPYVVKNSSGGAISYEVPWRDGTAIRTATRADLIRLLVPVVHAPQVEVLGGELVCKYSDGGLKWDLVALRLYVEPAYGEGVVFPFHRCEASFEVFNLVPRTRITDIRISPPYKPSSRISGARGLDAVAWKPDSLTVEHTNAEVIIKGPGRIDVKGGSDVMPVISVPGQEPVASNENDIIAAQRQIVLNSAAKIDIKLVPSNGEQPVSASIEIPWLRQDEKEIWSDFIGRWLI
jgi:hypothetical protein